MCASHIGSTWVYQCNAGLWQCRMTDSVEAVGHKYIFFQMYNTSTFPCWPLRYRAYLPAAPTKSHPQSFIASFSHSSCPSPPASAHGTNRPPYSCPQQSGPSQARASCAWSAPPQPSSTDQRRWPCARASAVPCAPSHWTACSARLGDGSPRGLGAAGAA